MWSAHLKNGVPTAVSSAGPLPSQSHTYGEEGPYTATIAVTDTLDGQSDSKTFTATVSAKDVNTWWIASASGGLVKTINNGITFEHQFDHEKTVSIGDVAVAPSDPRMTHWRRPKTLAGELEALGVKPADVKYVAVSHTHPDHVGNIKMFPQSTVLVQKAEYDWPTPFGRTLQAVASPVNKLEGDHDVFGDGSVTIIATPGHTPGHQSLLVKLPKTGALVLSGDAVHFKSNWENRRVPSMNADNEKTLASMQRIADILVTEKAQLWINHDKAQRDSLKMAPGYYD